MKYISNISKKIILISFILLSGFTNILISAQSAFINPLGIKDMNQLFKSLEDQYFTLIASLGLLVSIIIAGFVRLYSQGDTDKEKKSKNILTYAIVGFILIIFARFIIGGLTSLLGVKI